MNIGKLENKVAVITGATRGIGEGIAKVFAGYGAKLVLVGRSKGIFDIAEILRQDGAEAVAVQADVGNPEDAERIAKTAIDNFGTVDIFVGNAAVFDASDIVSLTEETRDRVWSTNVNGNFNVLKVLLPYMMEKKCGKVAIVSSVTGFMVANPNRTAYATSKAAVIGLVKSLASEMAQYHINVNAICPGIIQTPMVEEVAAAKNPRNVQAALDEMGANIPWRRLGQPCDVGELVAFLCSHESDYVTGTQIVIDGGNSVTEH
jgi:NAD(P)-dependent dehydrogenase (short-subunit alcohol dehydrogenase family)